MGRQADANAFVPLPVRDGVAPSYLWLDDAAPGPALAFLSARFPDVAPETWRDRMARGDVVDAAGAPLAPDSLLRRGMRLWYYRELAAETPIPFEEQIVHLDEHLVVVDKPHFLPTTPGGRFLHESLLVRLKNRLGETQLTPIHRLDRETAGVVIFSRREDSRGAYQSLFQRRSVAKVYEALAAPLPGRTFPFTYLSRIEPGTPFFRMQEVAGEPNSETLIDVAGMRGDAALYRLAPRTNLNLVTNVADNESLTTGFKARSLTARLLVSHQIGRNITGTAELTRAQGLTGLTEGSKFTANSVSASLNIQL